jgi:hypothetical protein
MAGSASSVAARNRKLSLQEIFLHSQDTIIHILAYRVKTRIRTAGRRTTTDGRIRRTDSHIRVSSKMIKRGYVSKNVFHLIGIIMCKSEMCSHETWLDWYGTKKCWRRLFVYMQSCFLFQLVAYLDRISKHEWLQSFHCDHPGWNCCTETLGQERTKRNILPFLNVSR